MTARTARRRCSVVVVVAIAAVIAMGCGRFGTDATTGPSSTLDGGGEAGPGAGSDGGGSGGSDAGADADLGPLGVSLRCLGAKLCDDFEDGVIDGAPWTFQGKRELVGPGMARGGRSMQVRVSQGKDVQAFLASQCTASSAVSFGAVLSIETMPNPSTGYLELLGFDSATSGAGVYLKIYNSDLILTEERASAPVTEHPLGAIKAGVTTTIEVAVVFGKVPQLVVRRDGNRIYDGVGVLNASAGLTLYAGLHSGEPKGEFLYDLDDVFFDWK